MGEKDTVDSITMMDVTAPFVVVLDPQTQHYHLPSFKMSEMTVPLLKGFLDDVRAGKSPVSGIRELKSWSCFVASYKGGRRDICIFLRG